MGLKFRCKTCGEDVVVRFLKVGEAAKCKTCGASNPVPESAESADDETAASYQSRAKRSAESGKSLLEAREILHDAKLWKTLLGISLMVLGLIVGIALPLLMMSPEGRIPNAGGAVPGIMLVIYGGGILNRLRQKALAAQQIPPASRPQDRKMAMAGFGSWLLGERDTHVTGFWHIILETIRGLLLNFLALIPLAVFVAVFGGLLYILSFPYGWAREAWFPGISQTMEIILVTIIIPGSPFLFALAMALFEVLSEKWKLWRYRKQ